MSIQTRFPTPTRLIRLATFFDPRTKDMQVFTEEEKHYTISEARDEYRELTNFYESNDLLDKDYQLDFSNKICSDEDIFLTETTYPDEESVQQNNSECEFDSYLLLPKVSSQTNILQWWESRKTEYLALAKLARKYLCIPAISVPSEHLFSSAGLTITEKQSRLSPKYAGTLLFLKAALKIWPDSHVF